MCGRYTLYSSKEDIENHFEATAEDDGLFTPNYNVAPGTTMPVVLAGVSGDREIGGMRWGLIPKWADDKNTGYNMINARGETLHEKKSFKGPFENKRCIVPANGFYEWKGDKREKQPFYIRLLNEQVVGFAGLYERWTSDDGEDIYSYTIITTEANALVAPLHDRMPVILQKDMYKVWLNPENEDTDMLSQYLKPFPLEQMATYRVTDEVNSTKNNKPELIQPIPK